MHLNVAASSVRQSCRDLKPSSCTIGQPGELQYVRSGTRLTVVVVQTAGTYLDQERLPVHKPRQLQPGQSLTFGNLTKAFVVTDPSQTGLPLPA